MWKAIKNGSMHEAVHGHIRVRVTTSEIDGRFRYCVTDIGELPPVNIAEGGAKSIDSAKARALAVALQQATGGSK